ncbi:hypothetical protein PVAND_006204 [Polypedilum vanderplanki]|uniref:Uncharacterized protein n=1 Tax=Polypedilum vanderplanki TaxID=319348 RepID=A0A9J6C3G7_POLVA|nr:hypothetical protein PVAND_006204 [Polypedilum vanderplanki]
MSQSKALTDIYAEMSRLKIHIGYEESSVNNSKSDLKIAAKSFKTIAKSIDRETAQNLLELKEIISCGLNLLQKTFLESHKNPSSLKHPGLKIRKYFCIILSLLIPEKTGQIIDIVLGYLRNGIILKSHEFLTMECLHCLSISNASCDLILEKIIDFIEEMIITNRTDEAMIACRALYMSVTDNYRELSATSLIRLLWLYHLSVETNNSNNKLSMFRTGFEITVKKIFQFMNSDELLLFVPKALTMTFDNEMRSKVALTDFGLTMQEAFLRLSNCDIERNLKPEILEFLLNAMNLKCEIKSFLACRYLTIFIDHLDNFKCFSTPKIFHEGSRYKITLSKETHEKIIEANHQFIMSSILSAIKLHGFRRENLNAIYSLICVMLTTMPSAITHVMIVDILMDLQSCMIDGKQVEFNSFNKNQIHAFIISVMTLICWTTRAKTMTKYIRNIVNIRHDIAPHLLPPLKEFYEYDQYHVLSYKPELFLDKWEIKYCLWNLFRIENLRPTTNEFQKKKSESKNSVFKFNLFSRKGKNSN